MFQCCITDVEIVSSVLIQSHIRHLTEINNRADYSETSVLMYQHTSRHVSWDYSLLSPPWELQILQNESGIATTPKLHAYIFTVIDHWPQLWRNAFRRTSLGNGLARNRQRSRELYWGERRVNTRLYIRSR